MTTHAQLDAAEYAAWQAEIEAHRREAEAEIEAARAAAQVRTPIGQCDHCRAWIPAVATTCPRCGDDLIPL